MVNKNYGNRKKFNVYDLSQEYGIGYTENLNNVGTNEFYFDLDDYDKIKDYWWYFNENGYLESKKDKTIRIHRLILNLTQENELADHIHGYYTRHDNRKNNLRKCTKQQNVMNSKVRISNNSGITGVAWDKSRNKWMAYIDYYKKRINLGRFSNFEDAVKVRKEAEDKYHGKWSYDNSQNIPYSLKKQIINTEERSAE